jgi:hypothetical protein
MNFRTKGATAIRLLPRLRPALCSGPIKTAPALLIVLWISLWPLLSPLALRAQTNGRACANLRVTVNVAPVIQNVTLDQGNKSIVIRDATKTSAGQFLIWPETRESSTLVEEVRSVSESGWHGELYPASGISTGTGLDGGRKGRPRSAQGVGPGEACTPACATVESEALVLTRTVVTR